MRFEQGPWRELAEGVHVCECLPEGVSVGLVVGSDGCVLVDTGSSPTQGRAIRESVAALTPVPLVAVVVTHAHYDHAFGIAAFDDVAVYGHASLAGTLRGEKSRAEATRLGLDPADLAVPNRPLTLMAAQDLGAAPGGGRRWVEVSYVGPAHTGGDLVVLVPDAKVLFAGDLVEESAPPSVGPDASLAGWAKALDQVIGLLRADSVVVPGHGAPLDRMDVLEQRHALGATWAQCEWLREQGVAEGDAYAHPELSWPYTREWADGAIAKAYAELAVIEPRPVRRLPIQPV